MVVMPAAVIAFSELMAMDSCHHKWTLSLYDTGRYMRLDAAAQRALNVMKQRTDANDTFSLYGLMNRGRTPMAKRLLKVQHLLRSALHLSIRAAMYTRSKHVHSAGHAV